MRFEEIIVFFTVLTGSICLVNFLYRKIKHKNKSTATTEIYTHLSNAILQEAADHSPLAEIINHPASDESEPDAPDVVSVVLPDVLPENENKE